MGFEHIVGVAIVLVVVGEVKVVAPLRERYVKALIHEMESDPFFFSSCIQPNGVLERAQELQRQPTIRCHVLKKQNVVNPH
jgi:hypothetical protein